jgi:hypothetical protein
MTLVLNIFLQCILVASLALFLYVLVRQVFQAPNGDELLYRSLALVGGAVVALGAQVSGVSFATFTVHALSQARPVGFGVGLLATVLPGGVGAVIGWYYVRVKNRSGIRAMRYVIFIGMLTVVGFAEIYGVATSTKGVILGAAALPNAAFVVGIVLTIVLTANAADEVPGTASPVGFMKRVIQRRRSGDTVSAAVRDATLGAETAPRRANPWARN